VVRDIANVLLGSRLNALLLLAPITVALELLHAPAVAIFVVAALAILPLAGLIGHATEELTAHTGPGVGGLLNATFGNAVELILASFALAAGLQEVVKASITGAILGNVLLVLGLSMIAGGLGRPKQTFNQTAAGASAAMLALAVAALVMPATFQLAVFRELTFPDPQVYQLSFIVALVLIAVYVGSLVFALVTHQDLFRATAHGEGVPARISVRSAVGLLLAATVVTALVAEVLVGSLEAAATTLGLTEFFIGIIVVAVVGNAAEHFAAVVVARKDLMDLAVTIAIGSGTQIALLVGPVLVLLSFAIGQPMALVFNALEIAALALAVIVVAIVSLDGESNWFEGLQLLGLYVILAVVFFFVPAHVGI
jgi:Ca2+:H+ antiporter